MAASDTVERLIAAQFALLDKSLAEAIKRGTLLVVGDANKSSEVAVEGLDALPPSLCLHLHLLKFARNLCLFCVSKLFTSPLHGVLIIGVAYLLELAKLLCQDAH